MFINVSIGAIVAIFIKNISVVDTFWGLGPLLVNGCLFLYYPTNNVSMIFSILVSMWSIRLMGFFLITRIFKGKQDKRYTKIQDQWNGPQWIKTFGHFYMQGILQFILCLTFIPIYLSLPEKFSMIQMIACVVCLIAICAEAVADLQLYLFKKDQSGAILRTGLWSICRHPNYFFDWLVWCSLALFSYGYNGHIFGWVSAINIFIIMRFITGPYTERVSIEKRGNNYRNYQKEVPMFFPSIRLIFRNLK